MNESSHENFVSLPNIYTFNLQKAFTNLYFIFKCFAETFLVPDYDYFVYRRNLFFVKTSQVFIG